MKTFTSDEIMKMGLSICKKIFVRNRLKIH